MLKSGDVASVYTHISIEISSLSVMKSFLTFFFGFGSQVSHFYKWVSVSFPFTEFQMATGMKWNAAVVGLMQSKKNGDSSHTCFGLEGAEPPLNTLSTYR